MTSNATTTDPTTPKVLDVLVIGGGLSGLVVARGLHERSCSWKLFEARSELGGRLTNDSRGQTIDLGGAWIWPDHQPLVKRLVRSLGIPTFFQPGDASSTRLEGGAVAMIERISNELPRENLCTARPVTKLTMVASDDNASSARIRVDTRDGDFIMAKHVVLAAPPRLIAKHIAFDPPLSPAKRSAQKSSHTWMAGVTKVALVYPRKFWDDDMASKGFSRNFLGPAFQMYDASTNDGRVSALTCFCLVPPGSPAKHDDRVLADQLVAQIATVCYWYAREKFGAYTDVHIQHWPHEKYISEDANPTQIRAHPLPVAALAATEWDGRLHFAGSESDQRSPGVMEGAVGAAHRVLGELRAAWEGQE